MPDKSALFARLDQTRAETESVLHGLDPEKIIYPEGEWTVKDIIGHLATWEQAALTALQAHADGGEALLPPDLREEDYNALNVARRKHFPLEKIMQEWTDTREWFKQAIEELRDSQFEKPLHYWWEDSGSVAQLVEELIEHELEHRQDILS